MQKPRIRRPGIDRDFDAIPRNITERRLERLDERRLVRIATVYPHTISTTAGARRRTARDVPSVFMAARAVMFASDILCKAVSWRCEGMRLGGSSGRTSHP